MGDEISMACYTHGREMHQGFGLVNLWEYHTTMDLKEIGWGHVVWD